MANYASLRGPVGINRTYVHVPGLSADPVKRQEQWLNGLKAGNTIATNGPLIGFSVDGSGPGESIALGSGSHTLHYEGFLRSVIPVDHLEIVLNGDVIRTIEPGDSRTSADLTGSVTIDESGWLLLRAWNDGAHPLIFDRYPYATTTPVFVSVGGETPRSSEDAEFYIAWIERIRQSVTAHSDYNNDAEREAILENLANAQQRFEACR
jgi:hypothetical protein